MSTDLRWESDDSRGRYDDYYWWADELPARKFYLFLAEIGRQLRSLMTYPGPVAMLDLCEKCAEGEITEDELSDRCDDLRPPGRDDSRFDVWAANNLFWWVADRDKVNFEGVYFAARVPAYSAAIEAGLLSPGAEFDPYTPDEHPDFGPAIQQTQLEWGGLIRCVYGPDPFRPAAFAPSWRTETAVALARTMYEGRDFAALPVLADALEEAGCDHPDILAHCRGPGPHVRGCWVVDLVLGNG